MSEQGDHPPSQRGHQARGGMVQVGLAQTESSQEPGLGGELVAILEHPSQAGSCQVAPVDMRPEGSSLCLPVLTSLARQVVGWGPPWAVVERAATKLAAGFPPREAHIRISVFGFQVVVVGAHVWAGKAIVGVFQAWSVLIPRSFSDLSPSVTVFTGPTTQESKISCRE